MVYNEVQFCNVTTSTFKKSSPSQNFALKLIEIGNSTFSNNWLHLSQGDFHVKRLQSY